MLLYQGWQAKEGEAARTGAKPQNAGLAHVKAAARASARVSTARVFKRISARGSIRAALLPLLIIFSLSFTRCVFAQESQGFVAQAHTFSHPSSHTLPHPLRLAAAQSQAPNISESSPAVSSPTTLAQSHSAPTQAQPAQASPAPYTLDPTTAQNYVLDNPSHLLIPKSVAFVNLLSNELYAKSGYSLYVAVVDRLPDSELSESSLASSIDSDPKAKRTLYKQQLTQSLKAPYTLILFMKHDEKIDIISSSPQTYLDEDKVFFEYMIPLLPKQKDEALTPERISAIMLNGYATAADMIAQHFDITLEHNMPVDESGGRDFVRFSMYAMLLVLFGIIGFIYLTRKK